MSVDRFNHRNWRIRIPPDSFEGLNDIHARVDFEGLVCRIFNRDSGMLENDPLWAPDLERNVGLKRVRKGLANDGLVLCASSADGMSKASLSSDGMTLEEKRAVEQDGRLNEIRFVPVYKLLLEVVEQPVYMRDGYFAGGCNTPVARSPLFDAALLPARKR